MVAGANRGGGRHHAQARYADILIACVLGSDPEYDQTVLDRIGLVAPVLGATRLDQQARQADIVSGPERRQQRGYGGMRGVFVELFEVQRLQRLRMAHRLQVRARGLGALDDEVVEPARAGGHVRTPTPSVSSIPVSAISGRPSRAVGSGLSMRSISAMPSDSLLAEPAQS